MLNLTVLNLRMLNLTVFNLTNAVDVADALDDVEPDEVEPEDVEHEVHTAAVPLRDNGATKRRPGISKKSSNRCCGLYETTGAALGAELCKRSGQLIADLAVDGFKLKKVIIIKMI